MKELGIKKYLNHQTQIKIVVREMIEQLDDNIKSESGDSSTSIEQSPLLGPKIDFEN